MMKYSSIHKKISTNTGYLLLLVIFFLFSYILPLGNRELVAPDETRYADIPYEMIHNGNWIVPRLNGLRYFEKPVLGYWAQACSLLLFGKNNFAVRFPSAMSTALSAFLIYMMLRRASRNKNKTLNDRFSAISAVFIFLSCFEVFVVGNTAVLDNLFSFFTTASIAAFYFASEEQSGSHKEKYFLFLAGMSCGLAFMTKGFTAFVVPVLSLAAFLIWQRRYYDILRMGWLPVISAVVIVLPWALAIYFMEPDFWNFFFWNEHIRRFMADNAQHKESFWFFFMAAPGAFFPWTSLVPAAVMGLRSEFSSEGRQNNLQKLCICWLVLPFLFFSFSNGKLLTYILPCFPPFAVLMSTGISHILDKNMNDRVLQKGIVLSALFFAVILIAFLYLQVLGFNGFRPYDKSWESILIINALIFFILFCIQSFKSPNKKNKIMFYSMAPLLLFFVVHYTIPAHITEESSPETMLRQYKNNISGYNVVISDEDSIGAVCWYLKNNDVYVIGEPGELSYGLRYRDAQNRQLDKHSAALLINKNRGRTLLFTRSQNIKRWQDNLPKPVFQRSNGPSGFALAVY